MVNDLIYSYEDERFKFLWLHFRGMVGINTHYYLPIILSKYL
jgi:hypothetical protein